jgi:hypothetical protein
LLADYRSKRKFSELRKAIESGPFEVLREEIINQQVVLALQNDWANKANVYKNFVPPLFRQIGLQWAAKVQSRLIKKFSSNEKIYFSYILKKQPG